MSVRDYVGNLSNVVFVRPFVCAYKMVIIPLKYPIDFFGAIFGVEPGYLDKEEVEIEEVYIEAPRREPCPYRVFINQRVWLEMIYYVKGCKTEMGGHLKITHKEEDIIVDGLYIPNQEVSGADYTPSHRELAKNPKILPKIRGWFHSHVDFGAYWSGQDEDTITNSLSVFDKFCVSVVMNKKYEYRIRLDVKERGEVKTYDELPLNIILDKDRRIESSCKTMLNNKVKTRSFFKEIVNTIEDIIPDWFKGTPEKGEAK